MHTTTTGSTVLFALLISGNGVALPDGRAWQPETPFTRMVPDPAREVRGWPLTRDGMRNTASDPVLQDRPGGVGTAMFVRTQTTDRSGTPPAGETGGDHVTAEDDCG